MATISTVMAALGISVATAASAIRALEDTALATTTDKAAAEAFASQDLYDQCARQRTWLSRGDLAPIPPATLAMQAISDKALTVSAEVSTI